MYDKNRYTYEVKSRVPRVMVPVKPRMSPALVVLVVIIALGALVGCGFLGAKLATQNVAKQSPAEVTTTVIYRDVTDRSEDVANLEYTGQAMTSAEVAAFAKQSVVEIVTESASYGGYMGQYIKSGAGSGVIISGNGDILTNYHVIQGARTITVTLYDGQSFEAKLVGGDAVTDTAVIRINATTENAAVIGRSDNILAGQEVIAIGNPLGKLGGSVTKGVISAPDREITIDGQSMNLVQIDASVNPGNSGGGLFNMYGALIGIVNAKSVATNVEGIGFAVPIDVAYKEVAHSLMVNGRVEGRVDTSIFEFIERSEDSSFSGYYSNAGLYVKSKNSSNKSDVPTGAYIVSVDGVQIKTVTEWKNALNKKRAGESVKIVYQTGGMTLEAQIKLPQRLDYDR